VLGHPGPPKSAQRHKVLADAFKLAWTATTICPRPQLILCLSYPLAAAPFLPSARSWAARALQDHGITVSVVSLPDNLRQHLLEAQRASAGDHAARLLPSPCPPSVTRRNGKTSETPTGRRENRRYAWLC
jgi:hypothetical protein